MRIGILCALAVASFPCALSAQDFEGRMSSDVSRHALIECYKSNIVKLGASNKEPADTLLPSVEFLCKDEYTSLGFAYLDENSSIMPTLRRRDLEEARSQATIALIEARAKNPGD